MYFSFCISVASAILTRHSMSSSDKPLMILDIDDTIVGLEKNGKLEEEEWTFFLRPDANEFYLKAKQKYEVIFVTMDVERRSRMKFVKAEFVALHDDITIYDKTYIEDIMFRNVYKGTEDENAVQFRTEIDDFYKNNKMPREKLRIVNFFNKAKGIPSKPLELIAPLRLTDSNRFDDMVILDDRCENYKNIYDDERYRRYYEKCKLFTIPHMSLDTIADDKTFKQIMKTLNIN